MFSLYEKTAGLCSKIITREYSTSFSLGIQTLHKKFHEPIYAIYGMVRYADEIVDTFHDYNKKQLLEKFKRDTFEAIAERISLNPVLHSFQRAVHTYGIPLHLVEAFFKSMEMDLYETAYGEAGYQEYIYGSAEVVGLMCLKVFTEGDEVLYERLQKPARALGAAFQKVNFLRDMKSDYHERGRVYFPGIDFTNFREESKRKIEAEIENDFAEAYRGIMQLPISARAGVLLAYRYYLRLFERIKRVPVNRMMEERIRVPDYEKLTLLAGTMVQQQVSARLAYFI
ncbi:MAG: phytoene/squalene synthase family protein [Chitinophagales bacterium]|nr:phytoene/squalene synthase family protein [Chitinophagales bacterium]MDW8418486.1 phytoene/squalene synthase family protein [Chitinophagales bacterium]